MNKIFIISLAAALIGCSKNIEQTDPPEQIDRLSPVSFSAIVADVNPADVQSKLTGTTWKADDQITIFSDEAVKFEKAVGGTLAPSKLGTTYKAVVADGTTTWVPHIDWQHWYWADATTEHTFYACYLARSISSYGAIVLPPLYQNQALMYTQASQIITLADLQKTLGFMVAEPLHVKKASAVPLVMKQAFVAIEFNITVKEGDFSETADSRIVPELNAITLTSTNNVVNSDQSTINLATKVITEPGFDKDHAYLKRLYIVNGSKAPRWTLSHSKPFIHSSLVLPNTGKISVEFKVIVDDFFTTLPVELSPISYEAGKKYSFDVEFSSGLSPVKVSYATVTPWGTVPADPIAPVI